MELLHILGDPFTSVGGDRGIAHLKSSRWAPPPLPWVGKP